MENIVLLYAKKMYKNIDYLNNLCRKTYFDINFFCHYHLVGDQLDLVVKEITWFTVSGRRIACLQTHG